MRDNVFSEKRQRGRPRKVQPPILLPSLRSEPRLIEGAGNVPLSGLDLRARFGRAPPGDRSAIADQRAERLRLAAIDKDERAIRVHIRQSREVERELDVKFFRIGVARPEKKLDLRARKGRQSSDPVRRLPAYGIDIRDRLGRVGIFLEITSVTNGRAQFKPGCLREHFEYIWDEGAVEKLTDGSFSRFSNMGKSPEEVAAAMGLIEDIGRAARANGVIGSRITVRLPDDVTPQDRYDIMLELAEEYLGKCGIPYVFSIHKPDDHSDRRNHHGHLFTPWRPMERIEPFVWKCGSDLRSDLRSPEGIKAMRGLAAVIMTDVARARGKNRIYTGLSYSERGLPFKPLLKIGRGETEAYRRGDFVAKVERNKRIIADNLRRYRILLAEWLIQDLEAAERRRENLASSRPQPMPVPNVPAPELDAPPPPARASAASALAPVPRAVVAPAVKTPPAPMVVANNPVPLPNIPDEPPRNSNPEITFDHPAPVPEVPSSPLEKRTPTPRKPAGIPGRAAAPVIDGITYSRAEPMPPPRSPLAHIGPALVSAPRVVPRATRPSSPVELPSAANLWAAVPSVSVPPTNARVSQLSIPAPVFRAPAPKPVQQVALGSDQMAASLALRLATEEDKNNLRLRRKLALAIYAHAFGTGPQRQPSRAYKEFIYRVRREASLLSRKGDEIVVAAHADARFKEQFNLFMRLPEAQSDVQEAWKPFFVREDSWPDHLRDAMQFLDENPGVRSDVFAEARRQDEARKSAFEARLQGILKSARPLALHNGLIGVLDPEMVRVAGGDLLSLAAPDVQARLAAAMLLQQAEREDVTRYVATHPRHLVLEGRVAGKHLTYFLELAGNPPEPIRSRFNRWSNAPEFAVECHDAASGKAQSEPGQSHWHPKMRAWLRASAFSEAVQRLLAVELLQDRHAKKLLSEDQREAARIRRAGGRAVELGTTSQPRDRGRGLDRG